ncbi:hypothetical protein ADL27_40480, partial [Streptomyces sp. NRRL F-6602]
YTFTCTPITVPTADDGARAEDGDPKAAALYAGFSAAELKEAGAVAVYDTPGDLLAHLDTSPLAA